MTATDTIALWLGAALLAFLASATGLVSFDDLIRDGNALMSSLHQALHFPSGQGILAGLGRGISSLSDTVTGSLQDLIRQMAGLK